MAGTSPKPFVFVLMQFDEKFRDIYEQGIKPACKSAGAYCERVDDQIFTESIPERVYNQIAKADIIVSDMTGRNANVFYETGYAHALGQKTILLTQEADDIPFDLKHYPHVVYAGSITKLKPELKKRIVHFIKHPHEKHVVTHDMLQYHINGQNIRTSSMVEFTQMEHRQNQGWIVSLDIHNPADKVLDLADMSFGIVFPVKFGDPVLTGEEIVRIDNENYMFRISNVLPLRLLPKAWFHKALHISNSDVTRANSTAQLQGAGSPPIPSRIASHSYNCSVRVFSELGMQEFPFTAFITPGF